MKLEQLTRKAKMIVPTVALSLVVGCTINPVRKEYVGVAVTNAGLDTVTFVQTKSWNYDHSGNNMITVVKSTGKVIMFYDDGNDLLVDKVAIRFEGKEVEYNAWDKDEVSKHVMAQAQKEFDYYLSVLKEDHMQKAEYLLNRH
jgi:hypothetical protein